MFAVNVKAAFLASRRVCEAMKAAGRPGRIVNITSGNYRYTRPDGALYSASKAALEMLTRTFALEYGDHGIAVNAVAPGLGANGRAKPDPAFLRVAEYYVANSPLGRLHSSGRGGGNGALPCLRAGVGHHRRDDRHGRRVLGRPLRLSAPIVIKGTGHARPEGTRTPPSPPLIRLRSKSCATGSI